MHLGSNIAKLLYEMLSPRLNDKYKHTNNKSSYPFQLPVDAGDKIYKPLQLSKRHISQHFAGSWNPYNPCTNSKLSAYRSVCWLDIVRHTFHTLLAPYLQSSAAKTLSAVIRDITIMLQRHLSKEDICEMEKCFKKWFSYLDECIARKAISLTVYRINMHLLSHVAGYIRYFGPMSSASARSMERPIRILKRTMKVSHNVAAKNNNILEVGALLDYLDFSGIVNFEIKKKKEDTTYKDHPQNASLSQLWAPFLASSSPISLKQANKEQVIEGGFNIRQLGYAIYQLMGRIQRTKNGSSEKTIMSTILLCTLIHASKQTKTAIMLCSKQAKCARTMDTSESGLPTHLVLGKIYEGCRESTTSNVPRVKETKKYVAFDASDLISPVSLLQEVKSTQSVSNYQPSPWYKVICNTSVFPLNMHETAGEVANLFPV
ncbi:hypothetical protein A0J61_11067 [Choanephora cucurbitarum]|uniref:Uncharacterized protein n=1 Tax=Choanephora cucurbitarum TaxID=101091 RepID=A0A1C7N0J5_9FUNG|nr:hypothetical protein A0J61_11067 [Choanephora cucurbitarum]